MIDASGSSLHGSHLPVAVRMATFPLIHLTQGAGVWSISRLASSQWIACATRLSEPVARPARQSRRDTYARDIAHAGTIGDVDEIVPRSKTAPGSNA